MTIGAIADKNCMNPECLAEEGERHDKHCTPEPDEQVDPPEVSAPFDKDTCRVCLGTINMMAFKGKGVCCVFCDKVEKGELEKRDLPEKAPF